MWTLAVDLTLSYRIVGDIAYLQYVRWKASVSKCRFNERDYVNVSNALIFRMFEGTRFYAAIESYMYVNYLRHFQQNSPVS